MNKRTNNKMKFDLKLLKETLAIATYSGKEEQAKEFIKAWVTKNTPKAILEKDDYGNLYVTKGKADHYPTFISHLDTVHEITNKSIHETGDWLVALNPSTGQQIGTGGDDLVGVYLCLEALRTYDNVKCFFPVEEEYGVVGTSHCDMGFFDDSQYVIQSDRRGDEDIVTASWGTNLTSKKFDKALIKAAKGSKYRLYRQGGLTDCIALKDRGLEVCAINIASAYFNPHTDSEVVSISGVYAMIHTVTNIVKELGNKVWKHKQRKVKWDNSKYFSEFKDTTQDEWVLTENGEWDRVHSLASTEDKHYCDDCGQYVDKVTNHDGYFLCEKCEKWYVDSYDNF